MFLSIFKMMLNAERCSVLPSSTVPYGTGGEGGGGAKSHGGKKAWSSLKGQ